MSLMNMREYHFGEFQLKLPSRNLERDGVPVRLGSKAFELLAYLAMHPGEVVTKEELLKAVWPGSYVEEKNLTQQIMVLRKALSDNLPTSGLAVMDFAVDDWDDVAFRRGELMLFVSPKLLKQASGG